MGRFEDVLGQYTDIPRPAEGYLVVLDHDGRAVNVSEELLRDGAVGRLGLGPLIKRALREQPPREFRHRGLS